MKNERWTREDLYRSDVGYEEEAHEMLTRVGAPTGERWTLAARIAWLGSVGIIRAQIESIVAEEAANS